MIKTIMLTIEFVGEGDSKIIKRIVDTVPASDKEYPVTIKEFKTELDLLLLKFGDITIPGTSE